MATIVTEQNHENRSHEVEEDRIMNTEPIEETTDTIEETRITGSEPGEDHVDEDGDVKAEDMVSSEKKLSRSRSVRGKAFSATEGLKLAQAWVSQRTEHTQQKDADLWRAVEEKCRLEGMNRSAASLKKVWSFLQRNTQKYLAAKFVVERSRSENETLEDTERRIMELYRKNLGDVKHGNFKFVLAANWLQHQPKFFETYGTVADLKDILPSLGSEAKNDVVMGTGETLHIENGVRAAPVNVGASGFDGGLKRSAPDMVPPGVLNGARPSTEKRQRTAVASSEPDAHIAGLPPPEDVSALNSSIPIGIAVLNDNIQQFLDIQLLSVMREGPEKRDLYNAIVEERKFHIRKRLECLRSELPNTSEKPKI